MLRRSRVPHRWPRAERSVPGVSLRPIWRLAQGAPSVRCSVGRRGLVAARPSVPPGHHARAARGSASHDGREERWAHPAPAPVDEATVGRFGRPGISSSRRPVRAPRFPPPSSPRPPSRGPWRDAGVRCHWQRVSRTPHHGPRIKSGVTAQVSSTLQSGSRPALAPSGTGGRGPSVSHKSVQSGFASSTSATFHGQTQLPPPLA